MGFNITKYGSGVNSGDIQFDVDKFDYTYSDEDSFEDSPSDYIAIEEEVGNLYTLLKYTETLDDMGTVSAVINSTDTIFPGIIQDITVKDRQIHEIGLAVPGNRKLFTRPSFSITSGGVATEYSLREGDIFQDRTGLQWRVIKTFKEWDIQQNEVFRRHVIRKISLEGSS